MTLHATPLLLNEHICTSLSSLFFALERLMFHGSIEESLMNLLKFGSTKKIRELVAQNLSMSLHYPTLNLKTPLLAAIERGDPQVLSMLIEKVPTDLNNTTTQPSGRTVLMYAAYTSRNPEILAVLIKKNADPKKTDIRGWCCLQYAIVGERLDNVSFLLDYGLRVDLSDTDGKTLLMISVIFGNIDVLQLLLDKKADINARDKSGFTALQLAVLYRKRNAAILLMERGSDLHILAPLSGVSIQKLSATTMPNLLPCIQFAKKPLVFSTDVSQL